jgi:adenosylhomocysteinase
MALLPEGALVAVGGAGAWEIADVSELVTSGTIVREGVRAITSPTGRTFYLLRDGECVNLAGAEGNPVEIMDLSLALQLRAADYIVAQGSILGPGVHLLPDEIDTAVAASQLAGEGIKIDGGYERPQSPDLAR